MRDRAHVQRGEAVREFRTAGHAVHLALLSLSGYAPDPNPDTGIWNRTRGERAGLICLDLPQSAYELRRTKRRLRRPR